MTTNHFSRTSPVSPDAPMSVVVDPGPPPYDAPPVLELRGPLDTGRLEAALERIAARLPDGPPWQHRLQRHGPGHHTLTLTTGAPGDFPAGLLADLLTDATTTAAGPLVRGVVPSPLQRDLLSDADATTDPAAARHVGQLACVWHGPLDPERFTAAWQSLVDRESVLRSAFDNSPEPRVVVHDRVRADVVRLPHGSADWTALVEGDRLRGLDPRTPGPLRVTVLGGGPAVSATAPPTRVLLTYHHALLDDFSARLLLREFTRAYLAGGRLPGGERRPDMGDYTHWLAGQDTTAARQFWSSAAPPPGAAHSPLPAAPPASGAAGTGTGRARLRLTPAQTARLGAWAAGWGGTESGALQAVWALLLYRATGSADAEPVRFSVAVSGRGIPFEGVERLPGALRNPLPLSVVVDPRATVPQLLAELRDRALDMAAYEWVSAGQIRAWTQDRDQDRPSAPPGTLVVFESRPRPADDIAPELAAQGIRLEPPVTLAARTAFPLTLAAQHDQDGGLVLTVSYDRDRAAAVADVLAHAGYLLHELPLMPCESATIADIVALLADADTESGTSRDAHGATATTTEAARDAHPAVPTTIHSAAAPTQEGAHRPPSPVVTLRPGRGPGAGTVCLLPAAGNPRSRYDLLARSYRGPEALVLLDPVPDDPHARHTALRPLADAGGRLVLGGFSGCGATAYDIARLIAANGGRPPLVVLAATSAAAADLARLLESAAERAG
ncbi:condensation domain-containing protein [Streptomyces sp. NPDC049837]|uniref:condensation domain-containing protein n=1 Tax=Streptomyces sp. NPDC049837 TaxID=3155277 RepID=UPI00342C4999